MNYIISTASAMQHFLRQRHTLTLGVAGVFLMSIVVGATYSAAQKNVSPSSVQAESPEVSDTALSTVQPVRVSGSSSVLLLGTVLSHETATIYPRRDGIIEDVYVDIGDTVEKGQVVALLLPKGVEGQSAALIAEKQARKTQAETDLTTAKTVANETLINSRQKINEKETELHIAEHAQEALLQKFAESEANVAQMREQAFVSVQNARQLIEWITLGSNSRSGAAIDDDDIVHMLGIQDSSNTSRYDIVYRFNALFTAEQEYLNAADTVKPSLIENALLLALDALSAADTLLQYTPTQTSANGITQLSYQQLTERLAKIAGSQEALYKAKEKLEDAGNSFRTFTASEPELYRAYRSGNSTGAKSNAVRMLEEQIRSANNTHELTTANQEQMIAMKQQQVAIASSMLQSEYAQSGHRQIQSPFTGIVSKRFIDVGHIVMPSMPVFELTGVPTSLSKKAKAEIQFGLPEEMSDVLVIGEGVHFYLQTDETQEFTAEVSRISPQIDSTTHTITVQAKIPDDLHLPHQTSVRVRVTDDNTPVFRIPSSAVKRGEDRNYIWIMTPDITQPATQTVSVIAEDGEFAEITGDIDETSAVILDPPDLFLTQDHD